MNRDQGRSEVLAQAAASIALHGYHGTSMRDLAKATGRGLASFYHLFSSKDDILFELQRGAFEQLLDSAEQALALPSDPTQRLAVFIANHVRFFVEQPDVMRVMVQEASSLPPERRAVIRELKQRYFAIGQLLLRAVTASQDPAELERSTYCMFGMLNWIYGWYEPSRHGGPDVLARTILRVVVAGAGALP